jgi:DNA-binding SARP family transcriptional activator
MDQRPHVVLQLLGGFSLLCSGVPWDLTYSAQSVVSFLALRGPTDRARVATALWPEVERSRAGARLRTAIWRVQRSGVELLRTGPERIRLADVEIDVDALLSGAYQQQSQLPPRIQLWGEFLPGWYDDWVIIERERFRERRLTALQALAERLLRERQYAASLEVAMACIAAEPLREAGHDIVARVHLAERNYSEAVRHIESYRGMIRREIADDPSPRFAKMLEFARTPRPLTQGDQDLATDVSAMPPSNSGGEKGNTRQHRVGRPATGNI